MAKKDAKAKKSPAKPAPKAVPAKAPVKKAAPKAPAKPAPKPTPKPVAKPAAKAPAKAPAKPAPKPAAKAPVKAPAAPAKPAPKAAAPAKAPTPPVKPAPKAAEKPAAKPAAKGDTKPEAKPEAKADPKAAKAPAKGAKVAEAPVVEVPAEDAKPVRKGITIVAPKPVAKKPKPNAASVSIRPPGIAPLIDPKNPFRKPLIASGPKAAATRPLGQHGGVEAELPELKLKTPFNKKELEHFRQILLKKRAELVGDVSGLESEALRGQSGSLSNIPSHMAEQGSEAYDQALSLDLAAADRKIIREIDDALQRIADGTYGVCEHTGKPIRMERLEELPWARYSIEAAREIERQQMRG